MRTIKLLAICILATFASCSWFDSKPIQPKIVGTTYLHYNAYADGYYATIDSVEYRVIYIFPKMIDPIDGMKVTVFETRDSELHTCAGEKSEEEIEELYICNNIFIILVCLGGFIVILGMILIVIIVLAKKQKDHENS